MSSSQTVTVGRGATRRRRSRRRHVGAEIWVYRTMLLAAIVLGWQFLPEIGGLRHLSVVFDPFYVSSPSRVWTRLGYLMAGSHGQSAIWPYLWQTVKGTLLGVVIGTVAGSMAGLLLSNNEKLQKTFSPFIALFNATPRIALIPVIVIICGPTLTATALTGVLIVFFLVFYNAFAGGVAVPYETLENARLLGASRREIMWRVRFPYVVEWTFKSLPNAVSFGLVAVVTAELLTGKMGVGQLLENSISFSDSTGTFAIVVVLAAAGLILILLAEIAERRVLHWQSRD
jgi:NitT/TauT family transport system permease protein